MRRVQEEPRPAVRDPRKKSRDGIRCDAMKLAQIKEPTSKFIKVRCPKCKNEQIMFGKAATRVQCLVCAKPLSEPSGGKAKIKARILEVLE